MEILNALLAQQHLAYDPPANVPRETKKVQIIPWNTVDSFYESVEALSFLPLLPPTRDFDRKVFVGALHGLSSSFVLLGFHVTLHVIFGIYILPPKFFFAVVSSSAFPFPDAI